MLRKHWHNGSSLEMSLKFQHVKYGLIYDFYSMVKSLYPALHKSVYSQYNNNNLGFLLKERITFVTNEEEGSCVQETDVYWRAQESETERKIAAM